MELGLNRAKSAYYCIFNKFKSMHPYWNHAEATLVFLYDPDYRSEILGCFKDVSDEDAPNEIQLLRSRGV